MFELTTFVVIGTDCTGGCQFNYHTITITTALTIFRMAYMNKYSSIPEENINPYKRKTDWKWNEGKLKIFIIVAKFSDKNTVMQNFILKTNMACIT